MSKFHNYSFNNTLLIAMQKPEATLVAGYKAWQKNFERHVNKEKAICILAPVPICFEDIPGDSKGYFHTEEKRIAVQENMSESQTLKTMVHEVAHSMLHNKEINRDDLMEALVKDRSTKEVEAAALRMTDAAMFMCNSIRRANQCFLWCILFEVAGIMTILFWGSMGAWLAIGTSICGIPVAMHMTFNGINVGLSFVNLLSIPNWIITMSFLVGIVGFLILFVWLLFRNPVVVEKGRYRKRNLITKEGVTFVKGSIHVRFMGQTDNKA